MSTTRRPARSPSPTDRSNLRSSSSSSPDRALDLDADPEAELETAAGDSGADNRLEALLAAHVLPRLRRRSPATLQVNLGQGSHGDAGPMRPERMERTVVERILTVLAASPSITSVDITGGAPELNPHFRRLVNGSLAAGRQVSVRCNLIVHEQPGQKDTAEFFAARELTVIASLPATSAEATDRQRGAGVFASSIRGLRRLNALGYGRAQGDASLPGLRLHLVHNPPGATLAAPQAELEREYRTRLLADHGVQFDRLLALANMPIQRFRQELEASGQLAAYGALLEAAFNPATVGGLMCRDLVSVGWDGRLSDCDFNLALGLPLGRGATTIFAVGDLGALGDAPIATGEHCLGCTAGQGSGCGGALAPPLTAAR